MLKKITLAFDVSSALDIIRYSLVDILIPLLKQVPAEKAIEEVAETLFYFKRKK